jgi:hypothetical protein
MQKLVGNFLVAAILVSLIGLISALTNHGSKAYAQAGYGNTVPLTATPNVVTETPPDDQPAAEQPNTQESSGETCQTIELDQQTTFQNGTGYRADANSCSVFHFSATENGKKIKYVILLSDINNQGVNLNVASANDTNGLLARLKLTPGMEKTIAPSALTTTDLRAKLISINQNQAKLIFARAAKKTLPAVSGDSINKALIIGGVILVGLAIATLLLVIFKRR